MANPITHNLLRLPEDVVADILARLAVKSLKRFMSVGKSWYSLIQTPQFISAHYAFSKKNKSSPLIRCQHFPGPKEIFWFTSNQTLDVVADVDIPPLDDYLYLHSFCNGIICLWYSLGDVLLWNPATEESKLVPKFPFESPEGCINRTDVVGVGYDSMRENYKVIRIDSFYADDDHYYGPFYDGDHNLDTSDDDFEITQTSSRFIPCKLVTLYDLATDSWRKFQDNLTVDIITSSRDYQFYSNGFYHCLVAVENEEVLLSFDMSNEVFITTQFPDDSGLGGISMTYYFSNSFMEINGSVGGIVDHDYLAIDKCYDVWVLGEVGVKESWSKLYTVGPISNVDGPVGVGCHGEIFFTDKDCNFVAWHLSNNRHIKILQLGGFFSQMLMYAESLVSLGRNAMFNH